MRRPALRRLTTPRGLAVLVLVVLVLIAVAKFAATMSHSELRRTATNTLVVPTHAIVPKGRQLCQSREYVAPGSHYIAPWVGGAGGGPGGPMSVTVRDGSRVVASGRSPQSYPTGITRFPLDRTIDHEIAQATICFHNDSAGTINMYGDWVAAAGAADAPAFVNGVTARVRIDQYGERPKTWWQMVSTVADRFARVKAPIVGPWAFWAALAMLAALAVAVVARVLREPGP